MNQPPNQFPVQLDDLYRLIGEREVLRYYQQRELDRLMTEVDRLQQQLARESAAPEPVK